MTLTDDLSSLFSSASTNVADLLGFLMGTGTAVTVDKLEEWLKRLDGRAPPGLQLENKSFEKSNNESLGLPGHNDFTVFAPYGSWENATTDGFNAFKNKPTPLQSAFKDVLKVGGQRLRERCFIDLASLNPDQKFFTEHQDTHESVIEAIKEFIKGYGDEDEPVIRFLVGDDNPSPRQTDWSGKHEPTFRAIFWPGGQPLIEHKKARLYVGYYNPNFKATAVDDDAVAFVTNLLNRVDKFLPNSEVPAIVKLKQMLADQRQNLGSALLKSGLRTISWNHGKILAVNGQVVMTGGQNYLNCYASEELNNNSQRIDHDIVDHSAIVVGDAAVSAHRYIDYFFKYLNDPAPSDTNSVCYCAKLCDPTPNWLTRDGKSVSSLPTSSPPVMIRDNDKNSIPPEVLKAPFSPLLANAKGKIPVLTVAKLGDWSGEMEKIKYPILVMDMLRDIVLNFVWQYSAAWSDGVLGLGGLIYAVNKMMSDDQLTLSLNGPSIFNQSNITPVAWASRYTRTNAITYASSSVILCQQTLVQYFTAKKNSDYDKSVTQYINTNAGLTDAKNIWDGFVWPFDLMIAIAQAIATISKSKPTNANDTYRGVYIVESSKKAVDRVDWEEQTPITRIRKRIGRIMAGLPTGAGGLPASEIDAALNNFLHFRRVFDDKGNFFSHSKIVCVDKRLMYIGSDNAYPCYNEEHGIWVDDKEHVEGWVNRFFDPYWNRCTSPTDEDTYFTSTANKARDLYARYDN